MQLFKHTRDHRESNREDAYVNNYTLFLLYQYRKGSIHIFLFTCKKPNEVHPFQNCCKISSRNAVISYLKVALIFYCFIYVYQVWNRNIWILMKYSKPLIFLYFRITEQSYYLLVLTCMLISYELQIYTFEKILSSSKKIDPFKIRNF